MPVEDMNEPDIYVPFYIRDTDKDICLIAKNNDSSVLENSSLSELFLYNHIDY